MDDLLTPVSTTYLRSKQAAEPFLTEATSTKSVVDDQLPKRTHVSSIDEALEVLRNQPGYDALILVLRHLTSADLQLHVPGSKSAAVVHQLVSEIAPNYWTLLREGSDDPELSNTLQEPNDAALFIQCLQSVAGLNAVLAHLKALIRERQIGPKQLGRPDVCLHVGIYLDLLASLLRGRTSIRSIWTSSTKDLSSAASRKTQSNTLLSLLTGGLVLSIASEALSLVGEDVMRPDDQWIAQGADYTKWIAESIVSWAKSPHSDEDLRFCSDLFQRGISLGYGDTLAKSIIDGLLLTKGADHHIFTNVYFSQPQSAKKTLHILLHHLSQRLKAIASEGPALNAAVSAAAGILHSVTHGSDPLKNHLIDWCATSSAAGLGDGAGIRRAVLAVLAQDKDAITTVFERSLSQFGDQLYIKHVAILQQNVHTEVLLLSAGYVSRLSPIKLRIIVRSASYLSAVSNRIAATQARARFLGMVVGESLSALADKNAQKLDFHMDETDSEDARWLKSLTSISDEIGSVDPLLSQNDSPKSQSPTKIISKPAAKPKAKAQKKPLTEISASKPIAIIEEVDSSEDEEDLVPYAKDTDPEDSDDDATLIQRNKPKAPVYIRDLILFLRDSESYDKQKLALQTAPTLIRRKANFGAEVSSHADELAGLLVGVQDKFDMEGFDDLKLQGMIALIVAQPKSMAPWFCRTFFEGDYSMSLRVQVLVAISLSSRELAGFDTSEYASASSFPSKRLPEKIEALYLDAPTQVPSSRLKALPATALDSISQSLASSFLAPMAARAADATTGPDMLKLQTFTARYKSKAKARPRLRAIPNTTAALLAGSFFFPLTAHFQFALRSNKPLVLNPGMLAVYLQTLGVVIHAAGPSTLSLPQMTAELWDLLLAVRVHAQYDLDALKGWMVALAALLEVNEGDMRRICEQQGREVVETREWVGGVFHRIRGDDGGEENEVKMLAAGALIKLGEAIETYQALLMGDMVAF